MQLIYLDDMQEVDALTLLQPDEPKDVTPYSEQVAHIPVGRAERVAVVWAYAYYRVPITKISFEPELRSYNSKLEPPPAIENVALINDSVTKKPVGVVFDVTASGPGSWTANVQVECTYFDEHMGREYTHRRTASFFISSQRNIKDVLEELKA